MFDEYGNKINNSGDSSDLLLGEMYESETVINKEDVTEDKGNSTSYKDLFLKMEVISNNLLKQNMYLVDECNILKKMIKKINTDYYKLNVEHNNHNKNTIYYVNKIEYLRSKNSRLESKSNFLNSENDNFIGLIHKIEVKEVKEVEEVESRRSRRSRRSRK